MTCHHVSKLIAEGTALSAEAADHLRTCPTCSALAAVAERLSAPALDPAVEDGIVRTITANITAVTPLAPTRYYAWAIAGVAIAAAVTGTLIFGSAGWQADSSMQRSYFSLWLAAAIVVSATMAARLMTPGALLVLNPALTIPLGIFIVGAGALLYPSRYYEHFAGAVAACISIGLMHAAIACTGAFLIVRRGAVLWRPETTSMIGLLGGFSGMVVLYVFCPHRDLWHFSLAHTTVPVIAAGLGGWIGRRTIR